MATKDGDQLFRLWEVMAMIDQAFSRWIVRWLICGTFFDVYACDAVVVTLISCV